MRMMKIGGHSIKWLEEDLGKPRRPELPHKPHNKQHNKPRRPLKLKHLKSTRFLAICGEFEWLWI